MEQKSEMLSQFSPLQKLSFLLANYLPFLTALGSLLALFYLPLSLGWRIASFLGVIYILPPIIARLILLVMPIKKERILLTSKEYLVWWFVFCLQVLYARFTVLEELLRVVPSLYSMWLRLWGSKIGKLTYWSPGTRIFDRSYLNVGDHVIFGVGSRLSSHVIVKNEDGVRELQLAPITVEKNSIIGAYSLLSPGTFISAEECTRAFLLSPPFSRWKDNRRIKDYYKA